MWENFTFSRRNYTLIDDEGQTIDLFWMLKSLGTRGFVNYSFERVIGFNTLEPFIEPRVFFFATCGEMYVQLI